LLKEKRFPMKKPLSVLAVLLVIAVSLFGCSLGAKQPGPQAGNQSSPAAVESPVPSSPVPTITLTPTLNVPHGTLSIWYSWDESQRPALLKRIAEFQKLYPDVQFDVQFVPAMDLLASFEAAAADGGGPSILIGPAEWGPELFNKGYLEDLSSQANPELLKTFNPAALGEGKYKGALIGLPVSLKGVVLYRNSKIIPAPPRTFDDLVAYAKDATQGDKIGAILERSTLYSGGHLYGIGGKLLDDNGQPAFNNEKGQAWLNLLQSFSKAGPTNFLNDNDLQMFKEGRVGFIIDGTWNMNSLADALGAENLNIDPWPTYQSGNLSGFVQAENIYIHKRSGQTAQDEDPSLAWKFLEFFLSPDSQVELLNVGSIPALAPANIPPINTDPLVAEAAESLADGVPYPIDPAFSVYPGSLDTALQSVLEQSSPPSTALQTASDSISAALAGQQTSP
jgi:maltose-binding protein MalE